MFRVHGLAARRQAQDGGQGIHQRSGGRRLGQGDEPGFVTPERSLPGSDFQRQARFAATAGAVQGEQPPLSAGQVLADLLQFRLPSDQGRDRHWQPGRRRAEWPMRQRAAPDRRGQGLGFILRLDPQFGQQRSVESLVLPQRRVAALVLCQGTQQQPLGSFVPGLQAQQPPGVAGRSPVLTLRQMCISQRLQSGTDLLAQLLTADQQPFVKGQAIGGIKMCQQFASVDLDGPGKLRQAGRTDLQPAVGMAFGSSQQRLEGHHVQPIITLAVEADRLGFDQQMGRIGGLVVQGAAQAREGLAQVLEALLLRLLGPEERG